MSVIYKANGDVIIYPRWRRMPASFRIDTTPEGLALVRLGVPTIGGGVADAWSFVETSRTGMLGSGAAAFDIADDTFKMALFLSTSNLTDASTTYAGVTNEHANANGYTTGGIAVDLTVAGTTTATIDIATDPVWTASGGSIVCRFAAIYEVAGNVLCWSLLDNTPADITCTTGNTLTIAAHASGVATLSGG